MPRNRPGRDAGPTLTTPARRPGARSVDRSGTHADAPAQCRPGSAPRRGARARDHSSAPPSALARAAGTPSRSEPGERPRPARRVPPRSWAGNRHRPTGTGRSPTGSCTPGPAHTPRPVRAAVLHDQIPAQDPRFAQPPVMRQVLPLRHPRRPAGTPHSLVEQRITGHGHSRHPRGRAGLQPAALETDRSPSLDRVDPATVAATLTPSTQPASGTTVPGPIPPPISSRQLASSKHRSVINRT